MLYTNQLEKCFFKTKKFKKGGEEYLNKRIDNFTLNYWEIVLIMQIYEKHNLKILQKII